MKLLHIDSSVLAEKSVTRVLSAEMVEAERRLHPGLEVTYRDLAAQPLQHFSGGHVAVAHGAPPIPGLDLPASSAVLEEFLAADILVIGAPMYNFTIPSQLKTWIDRLVLAGKTFKYENGRPVGLVTGKKMLVASSRGGAYAGTPIEFLDHQESYLKAIFGFLGVSDITFVRAENMSRPDLRDKSIADAKARISALAA